MSIDCKFSNPLSTIKQGSISASGDIGCTLAYINDKKETSVIKLTLSMNVDS